MNVKIDNLFALFSHRLCRTTSNPESDEMLRICMAHVYYLKDGELAKFIKEGREMEKSLPKDLEGYFKIINEERGLSALLAKAKKDGKLSIDQEKAMGISAMGDAEIYMELMDGIPRKKRRSAKAAKA